MSNQVSEQRQDIRKHGKLDLEYLMGRSWEEQYDIIWNVAAGFPTVPCTIPRQDMERILFPLTGMKEVHEIPYILNSLYHPLPIHRALARQHLEDIWWSYMDDGGFPKFKPI